MHWPQDPDCIFLFCRLATMVSTECFVYGESLNLPIHLFEICTQQDPKRGKGSAFLQVGLSLRASCFERA